MDPPKLSNILLTLSGVVALLIGVYLPLFQRNPQLPPDTPVPLGYVPQQSSGIRGFDLLFLLPAGFVVLLLFSGYWRHFQAVLSVLIGVLAIVFPVHYLFNTTLGIDASATFVPGFGWYGFVTGGILLVIAGGLRLFTGKTRGLTALHR